MSIAPPVARTGHGLPIMRTFAWALATPLRWPRMALRTLVLPVVAQSALAAVVLALLPRGEEFDRRESFLSFFAWFHWITTLAAQAFAAVSWHRYVALGPVPAKPPLFPVPQLRHWGFLGYILVAAALAWGAHRVFFALSRRVVVPMLGGLGGTAPEWILESLLFEGPYLLQLLVLCFLCVRLGFLLPATALDRPIGVCTAFRLSRPYGLQLLVIVFLIAAVNFSLGVASGFLGGYLDLKDTTATASLGSFVFVAKHIILLGSVAALTRAFLVATDFEPNAAVFPRWTR